MRAAGVEIRDFATEEPDLEDVFLALTSGAAGAPPRMKKTFLIPRPEISFPRCSPLSGRPPSP